MAVSRSVRRLLIVNLWKQRISLQPIQTVESQALASLLSPAQIVAGLDEHIVSQDYAKRALAVAVYNHYKRLHVEAAS